MAGRLNGRVTRLEDAAREHRSTPCRWHRPVVVYPTNGGRRELVPPCESPATCPGASRVQIYLPERRLP